MSEAVVGCEKCSELGKKLEQSDEYQKQIMLGIAGVIGSSLKAVGLTINLEPVPQVDGKKEPDFWTEDMARRIKHGYTGPSWWREMSDRVEGAEKLAEERMKRNSRLASLIPRIVAACPGMPTELRAEIELELAKS